MATENLQEKIEQGVVDIFCNPKVDSQASKRDAGTSNSRQ